MHEDRNGMAFSAGAKSYQKEVRFRAIADSVTAFVLRKFLPVDPKWADDTAHCLAREVAVTLLQRIYEEDAELRGLRMELEHYKKVALNTAMTNPPNRVVIEKLERNG